MLRYSAHAQRRLSERHVSPQQVERVCEDPDITYPDGQGNQCWIKNVDGRSIRVVRKGTDPDFIVTVIVQGQ